MIRASRQELGGYVRDLVATMERFGSTFHDIDLLELRAHRDGTVRLDLTADLPWGPAAITPTVRMREVWRPEGVESVELAQYAYELLHPPLDYRRALHLHQPEAFLRAFGRPEHEHCEAPVGWAACEHVAGEPVRGAIDGFRRLLEVFVTGEPADCRALRCLDG